MDEHLVFDGVLVLGAGLAGLTAALAAAPRAVLVLSPTPLGEGCASSWAQGGVAAALSRDDDPALHAADTTAAGAGLCEPEPVAILTREGPAAVHALAALGAPFDRTGDGAFVQSLEAAHSRPRVARVGGDGAGLAIMRAVISAVRASSHIEVREGVRAQALVQDAGGAVLGVLAEVDGRAVEILAPATMLATGGVGGLYAVTTNPPQARGEGLAIAALAGAPIVDPEFVQFHPTAIDIGADPAPLATEALRGEGARLIDSRGRPFMERFHPAGDLAPRDVVARAIAVETGRGGQVFLDTPTAIGAAFDQHFPAVFAACQKAGLDPRAQPIPVAPAAHYHMGGVAAGPDGRTSLSGLFAVGECAAAGVHGANRLASNSLLEAVVFGRRAGEVAREAASCARTPMAAAAPPAIPSDVVSILRQRMTAKAGVTRSAAGLSGLIAWIDAQAAVHGRGLPLVAARLIAAAALARRESRGAHFRSDYPAALAHAVHTRMELNEVTSAGVRAA
ncbi:MAG TPA: L-aspartate oxidase [Caulobacteraceae bacterium]|jgi:L-aspartate oxidase